MTVIGEKINGSIPAVAEAIRDHNDEAIRERVRVQAAAGADYLDCAAGTDTEIEYETMCWLIDIIQQETELPICIDSPDAELLSRIVRSGIIKRPGIVNSVNEEGTKCETVFPVIAGTDWKVIGLTSGKTGVPASPGERLEIARSIIGKADSYGVSRSNLFIDPCVMTLATMPSAMEDFIQCIKGIKEIDPAIKTVGALSNISFNMPARKYINMGCMTLAVNAGLDAAIMDPASENMQGAMYAAAALSMQDTGGRKYNRAYRKGLFGIKK